MAGPRRITRKNPMKRPQNIGANRNRSMRNNSRAQQNRGTFQGGISRNQGMVPPQPSQESRTGTSDPNAYDPGRPDFGRTCPPGQQIRHIGEGRTTCVPEEPNIAGDVPVQNARRAISPTPGKPTQRPGRRSGRPVRSGLRGRSGRPGRRS